MSEQQKKEFIESLKRLTLFYNNIKTYDPDINKIKDIDFI